MPTPMNTHSHGERRGHAVPSASGGAKRFNQRSALVIALLAGLVASAQPMAVTPAGVQPEPLESLADASPASPWSFNLTPYVWLTGVTGNYTVGPKSKSVDVNFIDIAQNLSSFPVAFMGRAEAHWQRLGFYMEGIYSDLTLGKNPVRAASLAWGYPAS